MAPRGRKRKAGLRREDAARDNMREYGFDERVINESIKGLVKLYGEDGWKLIEDGGYDALFTICLERQEEQNRLVAAEQNEEMAEEEQEEQLVVEQNEEVALEQNEEVPVEQIEEMAVQQIEEIAEAEQETSQEEETHDHVPHEQEQNVEDGRESRDHVGSSSASLVRCGAETRTQTCLTDDASITTEVVLDSSPPGVQSSVTSPGYALHSAESAKNSRCGWLSSEEETDSGEDSDSDDDEMIQLTPEPLCEELEELLRKVRGENTRKRPSRWDN